MTFEEAFPLCFYINLGRRQDRRVDTEERLEAAGIKAVRFPAVDALHFSEKYQRAPLPDNFSELSELEKARLRKAREVRGYDSPGRYALALTQRMAIREAKLRKVDAVMLLEDDVVLHPNFANLFQSVYLPDDWGIFYLGCSHQQKPEWVGPRCVKSGYAVDTHAVAIHSRYYDRVIEMLDRHFKTDLGHIAKASDQFLAVLHREIPAYACFPNLAWQDEAQSDLINVTYTNYQKDGTQRNWTHCVKNLLPEMVGADAKKPVKLGLLFLTRGDVNHPEIWREFLAEAPEYVKIFNHPKERIRDTKAFLYGKHIKKHYDTEWGKLSLVEATVAMLQEALADESLTHFILLSEACVPIKSLPEILQRLTVDPRPQFGFRHWSKAVKQHQERMIAVPEVPQDCWHFHSQWVMLDRVAATFVVFQDMTSYFEKMFVPDEAYFATVLRMQGYPLHDLVHNKDLTWTNWEKSAGSPNAWMNIPQDKIADILHSDALFARKFPVGADIGKYGLHRSKKNFSAIVGKG